MRNNGELGVCLSRGCSFVTGCEPIELYLLNFFRGELSGDRVALDWPADANSVGGRLLDGVDKRSWMIFSLLVRILYLRSLGCDP